MKKIILEKELKCFRELLDYVEFPILEKLEGVLEHKERNIDLEIHGEKAFMKFYKLINESDSGYIILENNKLLAPCRATINIICKK